MEIEEYKPDQRELEQFTVEVEKTISEILVASTRRGDCSASVLAHSLAAVLVDLCRKTERNPDEIIKAVTAWDFTIPGLQRQPDQSVS